MTEDKKVAVFQPYLDKFETDEMRLYCQDMIKQIPNYIFDMPSSTSGKWHNATQCQIHGQVYHIIMFEEILNYLLELKCNKEKFKSPRQRDAMRCVAFFHDALKCGAGEKQFTVHEHPLLACDWVLNSKVEHDIDESAKVAIARMCARHSGEFVSSKRSDIELPEPENEMERMIHMCDILSSRSNIDMQPPEYLNEIFDDIPLDVEFDENYTLPFGQFKGERLIDVYNKKPDYVEWMENNIHKKEIRDMIKAMKEFLKTKGE